MSRLVENFIIGIFSGTIKSIKVKLCTMVLLVELYLFILLSVTNTIFYGKRSVKHFRLKILCSYLIKLKLRRIVKNIKWIMNISPFVVVLTIAHISGR